MFKSAGHTGDLGRGCSDRLGGVTPCRRDRPDFLDDCEGAACPCESRLKREAVRVIEPGVFIFEEDGLYALDAIATRHSDRARASVQIDVDLKVSHREATLWPLAVDTLGQVGAGKRLADEVIANVGDFAQPVEQTERMQDAGINPDADVGVLGFDPLQGGSGGEGAFGDHRHRQPPASAGVVNVRPELA